MQEVLGSPPGPEEGPRMYVLSSSAGGACGRPGGGSTSIGTAIAIAFATPTRAAGSSPANGNDLKSFWV